MTIPRIGAQGQVDSMMDDNGPATKKAKADDVAITKAKQAWTDFLRDGVGGWNF